ncbi:MAG: hypothetical protein JHD35_06255 [Sphingopyxis sp.]|nr:hypothetical protein [Sphingopyxis sp.]
MFDVTRLQMDAALTPCARNVALGASGGARRLLRRPSSAVRALGGCLGAPDRKPVLFQGTRETQLSGAAEGDDVVIGRQVAQTLGSDAAILPLFAMTRFALPPLRSWS